MILIDKEWLLSNASTFYNKKIVVIIGAGVSVPCGIPDYRSKQGIFKEIKSTYNIKGEDFFNFRFGLSAETRDIYLQYIYKLKSITEKSVPSLTHKFFTWYLDFGKIRVYTQNIDGLEERAGLRNNNLVYLHGNLKYLKCLHCGHLREYNTAAIIKSSPTCDLCSKSSRERSRCIKRYLHTNIIHYHQDHPDSELIANCIKEDTNLDVLLVVGTSMNVFGVRNMIKYFSKVCDTRILVNLTDCSSKMKKYFTHFYKGTADNFFYNLKKELEDYYLDKSLQDISIIEDNKQELETVDLPSDFTDQKIRKKLKRHSLTKEDIVTNFFVPKK